MVGRRCREGSENATELLLDLPQDRWIPVVQAFPKLELVLAVRGPLLRSPGFCHDVRPKRGLVEGLQERLDV